MDADLLSWGMNKKLMCVYIYVYQRNQSKEILVIIPTYKSKAPGTKLVSEEEVQTLRMRFMYLIQTSNAKKQALQVQFGILDCEKIGSSDIHIKTFD